MLPPKWEAVLLSGPVLYVVLMGGAALFEYATQPWTSHVIPVPYTMFYGIGTALCALRGYGWGLAASLSWYCLVFPVQWYWFHNYKQVYDRDQILRLVLQIACPLFISWLSAQRREAEQAQAELLLIQQKLLLIQQELLLALRTGMTHKFNNFLMIIMGDCDLVRSTLPEDSPEYEKLTEALTATERAAALVESIRQHARAGRVSPELRSAVHRIAGAEHQES